MDKYLAPDVATVPEFSKETGIAEHAIYRLLGGGKLPFMRVGERGVRVITPVYRDMVRGKPVPKALLEGRPYTLEDGQ